MKDLRTIQVAEQLIKNLMWLERGNPLLSIEELLEEGCKMSERIKAQYYHVREFWASEVGRMRTLDAAMRYLIRCELDTICAGKAAPRLEGRTMRGTTRMRALTTFGCENSRDLSLPMARGRAEILGGGSLPICTTA